MDAQALRLTARAPVLTFVSPRTAVGRDAKERREHRVGRLTD